MAKKGQKFETYSNELREQVVLDYISNNGSYLSIAERYNIDSKKTVETWVRKYRRLGNTDIQRKGINKDIDYKERYEILKKYQAFLKEQREKK